MAEGAGNGQGTVNARGRIGNSDECGRSKATPATIIAKDVARARRRSDGGVLI